MPLSDERREEILRWHKDCECGCAEIVDAYDEQCAEIKRLRAEVATIKSTTLMHFAAFIEHPKASGLDGYTLAQVAMEARALAALASSDEAKS